MEKNIVKMLCICLIVILALYNNVAIAATTSGLKQEQSNIDRQIEQTEEKIDELEEKISEQMKDVKKIMAQISDYEDEISELEDEISSLEEQISNLEKSIEEKEAQYEKEENLLAERLVVMYENGDISYLDVLLSSSSITDFISKYYMVTELANSDSELLEKIENEKEEIENEKANLEETKNKINETKESKGKVRTELANAKKEKEAQVQKLSDEEKAAQKELEQFEQDKKDIEAELKRIAEEEEARRKKEEEERKKAEAANSGSSNSGSSNLPSNISGTPSASGYIFPLKGKTKANITTGYGKYSWGGTHTGIDVAISAGTPIYAVKAGTVETSIALRYPNGNYKSYGEYIVINHHDGTMTLYAHMLSGSRLVKKGETVKQGQQIGQVGSTGNSSGNHLHFEVRVGGKPVNPTPYLP